MKQLNITTKQLNSLKEMVRKLFPEYDNNDLQLNLSTGRLHMYSNKSSTSVHWFELCFTHIIGKLENMLPFVGTQAPYYEKLMQHTFSGAHPIDYLYKLFKKLK